MISKNSFFDLRMLPETLRRSLWMTALTLLGLLGALVLPTAMVLQHAAQQMPLVEDPARLRRQTLLHLQNLLGMDNVLVKIVLIALAVVCGIALFSYLHARRQTDFFHSLPLRRGSLFLTHYLTGIVIVVPIFLLMTALTAAIVAAAGYGDALSGLWAAIGLHLIFFLLIYTVAVLCAIVCGNLIISLLLLLWALFSLPLVILLGSGLESVFYKTYAGPGPLTQILLCRLSPVLQYFAVTGRTNQHAYSLFASSSGTASLPQLLGGALIAAVLLGALSLVLFLRRGSEQAGSAIAFPRLKLPLKIWCTVLIALGAGLLLHQISKEQHLTWMIVGFLLGGVLTHCLMEILYAFDLKAAFTHLRTLGICAALFAIAIGALKLDVTSFDRYLPAADSLRGVRISAYDTGYATTPSWENRSLQDPENIQNVLKLASYGIAHQTSESAATPSTENHIIDMTITYLQQNGGQRRRQYSVPYTSGGETDRLFAAITFSREYMTTCLPIDTYHLTGHDLLTVHTEESMDDDTAFTVDPDRIGRIVRTLRREAPTMTAQKAKTETPVLALRLAAYDPDRTAASPTSADGYSLSTVSDYIPVYADDTETLRLLQQEMNATPTALSASAVRSVTLTLYASDSKDSLTKSRDATLTDPQKISSLLLHSKSWLSNAALYYGNEVSSLTLHGVPYSFGVTIHLRDGSSRDLSYTAANVPTAIFQSAFPKA